MRSLFLTAASAILAACTAGARENASGQGSGSAASTGTATSRDFQVGAFDKINLTGAANVLVAVGGQPSVRAEGDAALIERLEIAVVGGELRIGMREGSWSGNRGGVTVRVTVPSLQAASLAGAGDMNIDRIQGDRFTAAIGGAGDLDIAQLRVASASFTVSGAGSMRAAGGAQQAEATLRGVGNLNLNGFEARDATVALSGTGSVELRATGTAQVRLSGVGSVAIQGGARCTVQRSGLGHVSCDGNDIS
ncbi:MAG TPA: head GIN domain-containing protein [Allosphingosinicella sp.]|nr:head GIN domain-containing protein [Allosphingosinicella sp.]